MIHKRKNQSDNVKLSIKLVCNLKIFHWPFPLACSLLCPLLLVSCTLFGAVNVNGAPEMPPLPPASPDRNPSSALSFDAYPPPPPKDMPLCLMQNCMRCTFLLLL